MSLIFVSTFRTLAGCYFMGCSCERVVVYTRIINALVDLRAPSGLTCLADAQKTCVQAYVMLFFLLRKNARMFLEQVFL